MVSIVVVTFGQLTYTQKCIESILRNTSSVRTPFEVIVVDNASPDGTEQYLAELANQGQIVHLQNIFNEGFPKACNQGVAIAKGEYVCLLNNDTLVTPEWLDKLLRAIKSDPSLAAVGPYANHSSGYQKANAVCNYRNEEEFTKFATRFSHPENYVDFLVFFCCLIRRDVWDKIGGLDADFGKGNYDDNLFCWRVVELGMKMKTVSCFIHHETGASFGYNKDARKRREYADLLGKNQKIFLKKINQYRTISLCMIVSDKEDQTVFYRCLDSVVRYMDSVEVVLNYRTFPSPFAQRAFTDTLHSVCDMYNVEGHLKYVKWTNFSDMRNKSLDMSGSNYLLWMDCDDTLVNGAGIRDLILKNPDVDAFRIKLSSRTELGTSEVIFHTSLFKNDPRYRFQGRVHEDINITMNAFKANRATAQGVEIIHHGYLNLKTWKEKNKRNLRFLLQDLKDAPSPLVYYHLINSLMILGGFENAKRAVEYVDECLEKYKFEQTDPLLPKLWSLRGICCMDAKQIPAAKQSLLKAIDEWCWPEAVVNYAKLLMDDKNWDEAIRILNLLYAKETFDITHIPFDPLQVESMMLEKLGDCHLHKALGAKNPEEKMEGYAKAEKYYNEYLSVKKSLKVVDQLRGILYETGRIEEAAKLAIRAVNKWSGYFKGWAFLGEYELRCKRPETAKVFFRHALRLKPGLPEALHNLKMLEKMTCRDSAR